MPVTQFMMACRRSRSSLLELDEGAGEILGVQEQHWLVVRPDPGLAVAENARALRLEPVARLEDVVDLVAHMMHAAARVALEEGRNGRCRAERLEQLDLGVRQLDEDD